eukprot:4239064-Amphidinium_carterae.1
MLLQTQVERSMLPIEMLCMKIHIMWSYSLEHTRWPDTMDASTGRVVLDDVDVVVMVDLHADKHLLPFDAFRIPSEP